MNIRIPKIEEQIERADRRWRLRRTLGHSTLVVAWTTLMILLLGAAAVFGWLTSTIQATVMLVFITLVGVGAWLMTMLVVWWAPAKRGQLISSIEASHGGLMDRLNTLAYLEGRMRDSEFAQPIALQAAHVLNQNVAPRPFGWRRAWWQIALLAALLMLTVLFYWRYDPWQQLRAAEIAAREAASRQQEAFEIPPGATLEDTQTPKEWREIRISRPGYDLRAAAFEIIELQIEVAASQPLQAVRWLSSRNGESPQMHQLGHPEDPAYGVYVTELDLPALGAGDWDVIAYYAEAATQDGQLFVSDLYFVEVFPLREQLASLPGGESGPAYELMQQLSSLVERQMAVMREQYDVARQPLGDTERQRRLGELARHEARLADAVRRQAARLKSELGEEAATSVTEQLEAAAGQLDASHDALSQAADTHSDESTRAALRPLLAARRAAQTLVDQRQELFQESPPTAEDTGDPWQGPSSSELAQARDAAERLADQQQRVAEPNAAREQRQVTDGMRDFPDKFPAATAAASDEVEAAHQAVTQAQEARQVAADSASDFQRQAGDRLRELQRELESQEARQRQRELSDLARQLDNQLMKLAEVESRPDEHDESSMRAVSEETQKLVERTARYAESAPPRSELRRALSPPQPQQFGEKCRQLGQSRAAQEKQTNAAALRESLQPVADALRRDQQQASSDEHQSRLTQELERMQRQADGLQAAREFVQRTLEAQRRIQREANPSQPDKLSELAERQRQLEQTFQQRRAAMSESMKPVTGQCNKAGDAMNAAAQALRGQQPNARDMSDQAGQALQELDSALEKQQAVQQLADGMQLQKLARQHAQQLGNLEQQPADFSERHAQGAATGAKGLTQQMERIAGQPPGSAAGMPEAMKQALRNDARQKVDEAADQLAEAPDEAGRAEAAGRLRQLLDQITRAAGQQDGVSPSQAGQGAPPGQDPLREAGHSALARGLRELESLARDQRNSRRMTAQQQQALREDAATQFAEGVPAIYGHNQRTQEFVDRLRTELTEKMTPVDMETIRQLTSQLDALRRDANLAPRTPEGPAELRQVDASRVPPAYRRAVEKYFENLSEKP